MARFGVNMANRTAAIPTMMLNIATALFRLNNLTNSGAISGTKNSEPTTSNRKPVK